MTDYADETARSIAEADWRKLPEADRETAVNAIDREAAEYDTDHGFRIAAALRAAARLLERTR